jgi:hypothetical protein
MKDHLPLILEDAIKGQCRGSAIFSCKDSAAKTLRGLLKNVDNRTAGQ